MFISDTPAPGEIMRSLGARFREYRLRLNLTQREVAQMTTLSVPTIYKFETGRMTDMTFLSLLKLMRAVGIESNWTHLIPELPESPYLYKALKKKQRVRHPK